MEDTAFDRALIDEAFALVAEKGFRRASVAAAARRSGLPLDRARARFPDMVRVLMRFGSLADQAALGELDPAGSTRDALFGMVMRRIDFLQSHRAGVLALLRGLPADPPLALLLATANLRSMGWLLEAAGISAQGPAGLVRTKGLTAVWLWTVRAWGRDDSADLAATMAALDTALSRAEQASGWLMGRRDRKPAEDVAAEETLPEVAPFVPPEDPASPPVPI